MRHYLIVILSVLAVLAANVVLDVYTDVPMLIRWAFSIGIGLLITAVLSRISQHRQARNRPNEAGGL
ncbi:hypothetical protein [Pseudarthrobacter sp. PS3-L1]|uniref:hypothetical protein n=1 Tax=Pseudarthrobacter sp. PS3-L1 TaxID=3046207 RepID=UPI0024BADFD6|nr:hypothetical protein [Pseudarthrobacter sp. PS3-L1]MDJ0322018.1 hypothetical protein [Pseudarthrobacter sp. PS3-L1]